MGCREPCQTNCEGAGGPILCDSCRQAVADALLRALADTKMDEFHKTSLAGTGAQPYIGVRQQLEAVMLRAPADWEVRASYFDLLQHISAGRTGLDWIILPELRHPLFFRYGSTDIANMTAIFLQGRYDAKLRSVPRHILDLGAYAGYAAVYLAQRFPNAAVLCVEPMSANFRILLLNTLPYRQITCRNVALWGHATQLSQHAILGGESGMQLADGVTEAGMSCHALTVAAVLQSAGWPQVDLVKCDINGGEASVFADPTAA